MPTYVYKFVDTGETIEVQQGFHDDNLTEIAHPGTGEVLPVKKVFTPVGVTFKGSGFFKTDNRGKKFSTASSSDSSSSGSESKGSKGSDSKGADSGGSSSSGSESKSTGSSAKSDTSKPTAASGSSD